MSHDERSNMNDYSELVKALRWIPVTERLPQIDVAVFVLHTYQRDEYSPITIGRLYQPCDKRRVLKGAGHEKTDWTKNKACRDAVLKTFGRKE